MRKVFLANDLADKGLVTEQLQKLIDEAEKVGGQVRFGAGTYESATLYMRSGVSLFFDAGARLLATKDYRLYSNTFPVEGNPNLNQVTSKPRWHDALIYGQGISNIAIEGYGIIDGNDVRSPEGEQQFRGPMVMMFYDCHNVRITGLTMVRPTNYFTFFDTCTDIKIEKVRTFGGQDSAEIYRSKRVEIADCDFRSGDDNLIGSKNEDVYVHGTKFNTPGGKVINFGCNNFHMKDCKIWSNGYIAAPFKDDRRYSNSNAGINLMWRDALTDKSEKMSDNWLVENVEFENIETVFMYDVSAGLTDGNNGKIVLRNVTAKNFMFPILVNGYKGGDFELVIEDSKFIRCVYDTTNASEGRVADDKSFIRANDFKKITLKNVTVEGVCEDAFHFKDGGEVVMQNVSVVKKVETADIENVKTSFVTNDEPETDGKFFLYDDVTSINVPNDVDESFLGAIKYI